MVTDWPEGLPGFPDSEGELTERACLC